ncbi:MAG: DNA alkylation repair protein [Candidatus Fermentibacteraceae bacterium]|nr:DNA alkylation repair protein [Candidatus Fermentibacteraceae bacterium]
MVDKFKRGSDLEQHSIYTVYMKNSHRVNNWDLVDSSAPHIAGTYLFGRNTEPLYDFAVSDSLWKRRIAIVATQHFIRNRRFTQTFDIADLLLKDREDLIHKAVGWMLREVGNRDLEAETTFLKQRYTKMPRTMLRYAIERFEESKRQAYLKGLI